MDHFVAMARLPEGLTFPAEFQGKIQYDAERHRLVYHGFMSKAEFDRLCALSDDWGYRRQLDDLFRECLPDPPRPKGVRGLIAALTSIGF
jgi:hypothetical protein